MTTSNSNSFLGCGGWLAPADDPKVRSLPPCLRWGVPGFQYGWPAR